MMDGIFARLVVPVSFFLDGTLPAGTVVKIAGFECGFAYGITVPGKPTMYRDSLPRGRVVELSPLEQLAITAQ